MAKRNARVLITGLTHGSQMYNAGDVIDVAGNKSLYDLAEGKLIGGKRYLEWTEEKPSPVSDSPVAPVPKSKPSIPPEDESSAEEAPEPPSTEAPTSTAEPAAAVELPSDLGEAIKVLVAAGKAKGTIVKELGKSEDISQRQVSEKFDELLAVGEIVAGESPGQYSVVD